MIRSRTSTHIVARSSGVDPAAVATRAHVASRRPDRGRPLQQHLPAEQHERPGHVEPVGEERPIARVGLLLGLHPANRQDHLVGLPREQVAPAGAALDEQPDARRAATLDLGAVVRRRAADQPAGLLLHPPKGGDVLVRPEQDARPGWRPSAMRGRAPTR